MTDATITWFCSCDQAVVARSAGTPGRAGSLAMKRPPGRGGDRRPFHARRRCRSRAGTSIKAGSGPSPALVPAAISMLSRVPERSMPERTVGAVRTAFPAARIWDPTQAMKGRNCDRAAALLGEGKVFLFEDKGTTAVTRKRKAPLHTHRIDIDRAQLGWYCDEVEPATPGVRNLVAALPKNTGGTPAEVYFGNGCHTSPFFTAREPVVSGLPGPPSHRLGANSALSGNVGFCICHDGRDR